MKPDEREELPEDVKKMSKLSDEYEAFLKTAPPKPTGAPREYLIDEKKWRVFPEWNVEGPNNFVHVIEKSAYDALNSENRIQWDMQEMAKRILKAERDQALAERDALKAELSSFAVKMAHEIDSQLVENEALTAENQRLREALVKITICSSRDEASYQAAKALDPK